MFSLPTTTTDRIDQALQRRICTATDGSYIWRSNGRRKAGRPTKYYISRPAHMPILIEAFDDEEAIRLANEKIAKRGE